VNHRTKNFNNLTKKNLDEINKDLQDDPSIKTFQKSMKFLKTQFCLSDLSYEMTKFSDIIIVTYPFLERDLINKLLKRLGLKINQLLIIVDEAHNLLEFKYRIIKKSEVTCLKKQLGSLPIINIVNSLFNTGVGKISSESIPYEERKLGLSFIKNYLQTDFQRMNLSSDNSIKSLIDKFILFIENVDRGQIYVYANQIIIADILPGRLLSNIRDVKKQIYQSATFFDLKLCRKLLGVKESTQVLDLISNPFTRMNNYDPIRRRNPNQLRGWLTLVSTRKRGRNEYLYNKMSSIISSIHETSPRHTLVLCPSYEFMEELIQYMDCTNFVIERRDISAKKLNREIFSLKFPSIILANQRGKIREGNEWVINGKSIVSTVVFAGLPTYVPSGNKTVENIIRSELRKKLGPDSRVNSVQFNIPLITNIIQSYGRSIRNSGDKGALVIIDRRTSAYLHKPLAMRRYRSVNKLITDLGSFFSEYPRLETITYNSEGLALLHS
jgi:Rad3-related DNA helicase